MKNAALFVLAATLLASCATSDDEPQARRPEAGRRMPARIAEGVPGLVPPPDWWRDPQISTAVKLSDAQFAALDAIGRDHAAELDRLRMDGAAAERDLRLLLAAEHPTANDIITAGQRVRSLRDQLLEHELRMLAGARALLTREQWTALEDALRDERQPDFGRRGGYGRGGGRRGGGRRPGF